MKITADTNVLLRLVMADDEAQGLAAVEAMENANLVAISVHSLCELAWVLGGKHAMSRNQIATAIRGLIDTSNVVIDRPSVEAGLAVLEAGGDFADGVIAFDGQWLGADTLVSFDKKAVKLLEAQGTAALLLA
ncbi:MAG TPA: type II toxin-antitoxin system VapC family toxin [Sphingomonas sp.]|jgi:predicted nucleic-acid-binding protein|nr:type II toxin-antitoxin system VapC family toxin [Sphingomonas sp.]